MNIRREAELAQYGVPDTEQLSEINRFTQKQLAPEQVFVFSVRLCDDVPDRDHERFDTAALPKLAELFVGKTGVVDHTWSAEKQVARIFRTQVLAENGVSYMILGQHFLGNEIDEPYCARETEDSRILERYVAQSAEALHTGLFTYFAHPDLIRFVGSRRIYDHQMARLCEAAKETNTPLGDRGRGRQRRDPRQRRAYAAGRLRPGVGTARARHRNEVFPAAAGDRNAEDNYTIRRPEVVQ